MTPSLPTDPSEEGLPAFDYDIREEKCANPPPVSTPLDIPVYQDEESPASPTPAFSPSDSLLPPNCKSGPQLDSCEGWTKVAQILQEVQERKVRDCKEDIDTLLVFVSK